MAGREPTKRPQYWLLFLGIPSRVNPITNAGDNNCYEIGKETNKHSSLSFKLYSTMQNQPFVTHLNLHDTNGCRAYIDRLEFVGTNYSPGKILLSASAGGYGNTNYYFDDARNAFGAPWPGAGGDAKTGVLNADPAASVTYTNGEDGGTDLGIHIRGGSNVAGYFCYGAHSALGNLYPWATNVLSFSGNSGWWIIQTIESYNGQWTNNCANMGNVS
jgi:hypothetical protein